MSQTGNSIVRTKASVTFAIDQFSQLTSRKDTNFRLTGCDYVTIFGINPKTAVYYADYVSIYFINGSDAYKFNVNVSILNLQREKLFSKEYFGEFGNGITENHFSLMPRSKLLLPQNGYLYYDKLTLLCEIEVFNKDQEAKEISDSIQKDFMNLSQNFQSLLIDGKFTDATLVVGKDEKEFRVHKAILSARSSVFAAMFEHDCEEKRQNKVVIGDMDEDVCVEMLNFVYSGKVQSLDRFAMELLDAADQYQFHSLKSICEQYMCINLSAESAVNVLILADLHRSAVLKSKCIEYISANVGQVESTEGWKVLGTNAKLLQELFLYSAKKK